MSLSTPSTGHALGLPAIARTPAQLRALRARVMVLAWRKARALVALRPALSLVATMRAELAVAWTKARQEERNGWLRPADAVVSPMVPPADPNRAAQIRVAIADLENRDRLGPVLMARLYDLGAALASARAA